MAPNFGLRSDKTARTFENFKRKLEAEKDKPGIDGVFARGQLELMPAVKRFFEGEDRRGTSEDQLTHVMAVNIANMLLLTGQLTTRKFNRAHVANEIMAKVYRLIDGKINRTAGGLIRPDGDYGTPQ